MDINESLENTILNERALNSELCMNIESLLFTLRTLNDSVGLDVKRLKPLIDGLYARYFYHELNYAKDDNIFKEKLLYIEKEYYDFFKEELQESSIYTECIESLFGLHSKLSTWKTDFIINHLNLENISDKNIRRIAIQSLNENKILSFFLEKKAIDIDFFHRDEDNNLLNRNPNLVKLENTETLNVFLKYGLDLNNEKKLTCVLGILAQKNPELKKILKNNLTLDKFKYMQAYVYNYENNKFINSFRTKLSLDKGCSNNEYYNLIAFRDFWKIKQNNENVFYNIIYDNNNRFDEKVVENLILKMNDDVDNREKYITSFNERNKNDLNMLEIILSNYSNYRKCKLDKEWLLLLIESCEFKTDFNYGPMLRDFKVENESIKTKLYEKIKEKYDSATLFTMFIGNSSEDFEEEIRKIINNNKNSPNISLLSEITYLGINDSKLFNNPYISGSIYLYLSYLNEKSPNFITDNEERNKFYTEIKNKKPLLHNYDHSDEFLKVYVSEMEKNHLLLTSNLNTSQDTIKRNKRL